MRYGLKYSSTGFCPLKIEITQSPDGFRLYDRNAIMNGHSLVKKHLL